MRKSTILAMLLVVCIIDLSFMYLPCNEYESSNMDIAVFEIKSLSSGLDAEETGRRELGVNSQYKMHQSLVFRITPRIRSPSVWTASF